MRFRSRRRRYWGHWENHGAPRALCPFPFSQPGTREQILSPEEPGTSSLSPCHPHLYLWWKFEGQCQAHGLLRGSQETRTVAFCPRPRCSRAKLYPSQRRQLPLGLQPLCSGAVGIHGKSQTVGGIPARSPHPHLSRHPTTADGDTQTLLRLRSRFLLR